MNKTTLFAIFISLLFLCSCAKLSTIAYKSYVPIESARLLENYNDTASWIGGNNISFVESNNILTLQNETNKHQTFYTKVINLPDSVDYEIEFIIKRELKPEIMQADVSGNNDIDTNTVSITFNNNTIAFKNNKFKINYNKWQNIPNFKETDTLNLRKLQDSLQIYLNKAQILATEYSKNLLNQLRVVLPALQKLKILKSQLILLQTLETQKYYVDKSNRDLTKLEEQSDSILNKLLSLRIPPNSKFGYEYRRSLGDNSFVHATKNMTDEQIEKNIKISTKFAFPFLHFIDIKDVKKGCATGSVIVMSPSGKSYKATFDNDTAFRATAYYLGNNKDTVKQYIYYKYECFNPFRSDSLVSIFENVLFIDCINNSFRDNIPSWLPIDTTPPLPPPLPPPPPPPPSPIDTTIKTTEYKNVVVHLFKDGELFFAYNDSTGKRVFGDVSKMPKNCKKIYNTKRYPIKGNQYVRLGCTHIEINSEYKITVSRGAKTTKQFFLD